MTFLDLLAEKKYSVYCLSKESGIALTTLQYIASGKNELEDCKGRTLFSLSRTLDISMEELLSLEPEEATDVFPVFLSECVKEYRFYARKGSTLSGD